MMNDLFVLMFLFSLIGFIVFAILCFIFIDNKKLTSVAGIWFILTVASGIGIEVTTPSNPPDCEGNCYVADVNEEEQVSKNNEQYNYCPYCGKEIGK